MILATSPSHAEAPYGATAVQALQDGQLGLMNMHANWDSTVFAMCAFAWRPHDRLALSDIVSVAVHLRTSKRTFLSYGESPWDWKRMYVSRLSSLRHTRDDHPTVGKGSGLI